MSPTDKGSGDCHPTGCQGPSECPVGAGDGGGLTRLGPELYPWCPWLCALFNGVKQKHTIVSPVSRAFLFP